MKKYLKFNLLVLILVFSVNRLYAQPPVPCEPGFDCGGGDGNEGQGNGAPGTPINDYLPMLVITAITIGGVISYKQKELFRK